jgi:hypothetical protein
MPPQQSNGLLGGFELSLGLGTHGGKHLMTAKSFKRSRRTDPAQE